MDECFLKTPGANYREDRAENLLLGNARSGRNNPAPFIDKRTEQPTHQAYYERAENRRPEPMNVEARHYSRSHLQKQGVYHECKEAQGEDIYRKGDNGEYRPEKSIQYTEDGRGEKCGKETRHVYTVDEIGCNNN